MSRSTVAGALLITGLVLGVIVTQPHAAGAPVVAVSPTPTPAPDVWAGPRWDVANLSLIAWLVALGLSPLLAIGGAVAWGRHRSRLIELDRPPVADREAVRLAYQARITAAGTPPLTHLHLSNRVQGGEVASPVGPTVPLAVPSLDQLLAAPGVVFGVAPDGHHLIDRRATSVGIGGQPGSGKTTTAALLLAQHGHRGARLLIGDPHAGSEESLTARLAPIAGPLDEVAETPRDILALAAEARAELERRQRTWRLIPPTDVRRVVLAIDEWTSLLRGEQAARLLDLLEDIAQQGRKYGVAVLLIAQSWSAAAIGSSQLRNPLPAAVLHRMRPDEARMLSGLRGEAVPDDTLALPPGEAYVVGVDDGIVRARVPSLVPSRQLQPTFAALAGDRPEGGAKVPRSKPEGREAEVLALARRGAAMTEIVRTVYGIRATGAPYQRASAEVMATIGRWLPAVGDAE